MTDLLVVEEPCCSGCHLSASTLEIAPIKGFQLNAGYCHTVLATMARSNVAQLWNGECCSMQQTYLSGHATHATTIVNPLPFVSVQPRLVPKLSHYYQGPPDLHMVA
jgi:hypothetical protein